MFDRANQLSSRGTSGCPVHVLELSGNARSLSNPTFAVLADHVQFGKRDVRKCRIHQIRDGYRTHTLIIVVGATTRGFATPRPEVFELITDQGARTVAHGRDAPVGKVRFLEASGVELTNPEEHAAAISREGKAAMLVADGRRPLGGIKVSDPAETDSTDGVLKLIRLGCDVVTFGDDKHTADVVARVVGIDRVLVVGLFCPYIGEVRSSMIVVVAMEPSLLSLATHANRLRRATSATCAGPSDEIVNRFISSTTASHSTSGGESGVGSGPLGLNRMWLVLLGAVVIDYVFRHAVVRVELPERSERTVGNRGVTRLHLPYAAASTRVSGAWDEPGSQYGSDR